MLKMTYYNELSMSWIRGIMIMCQLILCCMCCIWCHHGSYEYFADKYLSQGCPFPYFILDSPIMPYSGGGALDSHLDGGGGGRGVAGGGVKTGPCHKPLGAQKIHPVTIYLTKNVHMHIPVLVRTDGLSILHVYHHTFTKICCRPARAVAGAEIAGPCDKHCGLGSNPVINGVVRQ